MQNNALGIIETTGMTGAIEASDAMVKTAYVEHLGEERIGSGLVSVMVRGEIGAVKSAVEAGVEAAKKTGEFLNFLIIPKPHEEIEKILPKNNNSKKEIL
jgi:microcompartment protein CcmL/EutN